jgi:pyruvate dehydrogenase E2 component (dihydrolipoamide acetyltransferase)
VDETMSAVDATPEFIDAGGRRIRHLIQRGSGEAVILVHGIGGNLGVWAMNHAALAAGGRTVAAIDLPGHGESTKSLASGSLEELSSAVLDYMDAIGVERAHLVGHSMGGAVCLDVVRREPARVRSLVLLGPSGIGPASNRQWVERLINARSAEALMQVLRESAGDPDLISVGIAEDVLRYLRLEGATAALTRILNGVFRNPSADTDLRAAVGRVRTLVLWGGKDSVNPPPDAAAIGGENVEIHLLPQYGHQLPVEAAAEVNRLIDEFLGRWGNPAPSSPGSS